jgi:RNase P subunit RPR2
MSIIESGPLKAKVLANEALSKARQKEWNSHRILFKSKRVYLKENPRKGICMNCGKHGRTDIHHDRYNDDPLKHIVELCVSCHWHKSVEMGQIIPENNLKVMRAANPRLSFFLSEVKQTRRF